MKRLALMLAAIVLGVQNASASDTTGALVAVPIAGGLVGLVVGAIICAIICLRKRGRGIVWLSLPIFGMAGFGLGVVAVNIEMSRYKDKVVCSFGRYDPHRGGMGVIQVPPGFAKPDLEKFYGLLTNRDNTILSSHEFAAALVHQGNGIDQVYLNVYPSLDVTTDEYDRINNEARRQMAIVLKQNKQNFDARK